MALKINNSQNRNSLDSISGWQVFFVILILSFIAYGNTIQNDYNIDDGYVLTDESDEVKGIAAIPRILFSRYNSGEGVTVGYRPMGKVTMAIEYSLWGNDPHISHFVNIVLFALSTLLLFLFARRIANITDFDHPYVIHFAILIFIFHPIHTEVVCSIKNREEILASIFVLLALLPLVRKGAIGWKQILYMAFMMLLAFWSKQTAFVIFLLIPLVLVVRYTWRSVFKPIYLGTLLVAFLLILLVNSLIPRLVLEPGDAGNYFEQIPYQFYAVSHVIPNGCRTLLFYLQKLLAPYPLGFYYGYDMLPDTSWNSWIPYTGLTIIIVAMFYLIRGLVQQKNLFPVFWTGFFLLSISPLLNFVNWVLVTGTVGERLIYISSMGFCILLSYGLVRIYEYTLDSVSGKAKKHLRQIGIGIALLYLITFAGLTLERNTNWKDKLTLYEHDIQYLDRSARAHLMLAGALLNKADNLPDGLQKNNLVIKGKNHYKKAVMIYPGYDHALKNLGLIYLKYYDNIDSAAFYLKRVSDTHERYFSQAQQYLGDIEYSMNQDLTAAVEYYRRGLNVFPQNRHLYNKLVQLYFSMNKDEEVTEIAESAVLLGWNEAYVDLGDVAFRAADMPTAIMYYELAIENGFRGSQVISILKHHYQDTGDKEKYNQLQQILRNAN